MFRSKQTKIWRVKEDGCVLWGQFNNGLGREPKYTHSINKLLRGHGLKQIKVSSGPTFKLSPYDRDSDIAFKNYFYNHSTVDIIIPIDFEMRSKHDGCVVATVDITEFNIGGTNIHRWMLCVFAPLGSGLSRRVRYCISKHDLAGKIVHV